MRVLQPEGWPRPRGYVNGIEAEGRFVFVAGQIGWDESGKFQTSSFAGQFRQALANTLAILKEASAGPENITPPAPTIISSSSVATDAGLIRNSSPAFRTVRRPDASRTLK